MVAVLPHDHRVFPQLPLVIFRPMRGVDEEPHAVAVPEAFLGVVWILFLIRPGMMPNMIRAPSERRVLERPAPGHQQKGFDPGMAFKAAVRNQPVIPDGDPQAGHEVEDAKQHPVEEGVPVDIPEEGGADQRGDGDEAKKDKGLVGKWALSNSVRHPLLPVLRNMRFVSATASPGSARRTQISRPSPPTKSHHPVCGEVHLSYSGREREVVFRKSTEVADFNQEILSSNEMIRAVAGVY